MMKSRRTDQPRAATLSVHAVLNRLVLTCVLPGIIGAVLLLGYEYRNEYRQRERDTIQTARAMVEASDNLLARAQSMAQALAAAVPLKQADLPRFHALARVALAQSGHGANVVLRNREGRLLLNTAVDFGNALPAESAPVQLKTVFATGKPAISNIFVGSVLKRPIMSVYVPVIHDGQVAYALGIGILPREFNELLRAQRLPNGWIVVILDSSGSIVARSHDPDRWVAVKPSAQLLAAIAITGEGSIDATTLEGHEVRYFYSLSSRTGWRVAIGVPHADIVSPLVRGLTLVVIGVAVIFVFGLIVASLMGKRVTRALEALVAPAEALGTGAPSKVPAPDIKESADIAAAITKAAAILQKRDAELKEAHRLAKLGTWSWNLAEDEVSVSDSLIEICGREIPAFAQQRGTLLTEESWERIRLAMEETMKTGKGYDLEIQVIHGNGELLWMKSRCEAVRNEAGEVTYLHGMMQDINEQKRTEQRVRDAALHDVLTGLPNRTLVLEYCARVLAAAKRGHGSAALLYIDLDRFKAINDLYGHEAGDHVLREVATRLLSCTRKEDMVGRLGGDEFVIVVPNFKDIHSRARTVAEHIIQRLAPPVRFDGIEFGICASIGVSFFPDDALDVEELFNTADRAMYHAKRSGRANYQCYTAALEREAEGAFLIEARLRNSLRDGGLQLHYQPVVDVKSGELIGAEALVRLSFPSGVPITPDKFIPIAESSGLISDLGKWVALEACRQHKQWAEQGLDLTIAINVLPLQFRHQNFADTLRDIISDVGVDAERVEIEVTESAIMDNLDEAIAILNRIKTLGMRVALDDFGTGYSSLSSLTHLPIDKLKVDQSFIRSLETDAASRSVTDAIIALGRSLNLEVHGEGIESENALRYLREHGCDQAQGYWFSRPMPALEFMRWYQQRRQNPVPT